MGINRTQNAIQKDHFYSKEDALIKMQREKEKIRKRHEVQLKIVNSTSEQIDLCKNKELIRKDDKVVDIFQQWKKKQISPLRFKNTHESLFEPEKATPKMKRLMYLVKENTKGRKFNILTGGDLQF
jgi:thiamine pyrophosphate-dependent acetolactate synthase large subunit-like protein